MTQEGEIQNWVRTLFIWFCLVTVFVLVYCLLTVVYTIDQEMDPYNYANQFSYSTYDDLSKERLPISAWIPEFVPSSATNIQLCIIPENGMNWLRFDISKATITESMHHVTPLGADAVQFPRRVPELIAPWWPKELVQGSSQSQYSHDGEFEYYRVASTTDATTPAFIALDRSTGTVWHWQAWQ